MKGVVKYRRGSGFVEFRDVEEQPPGPSQVKIEVKASGICGSDLHILHDTINYRIRTPVVMGHEFSGGGGRKRGRCRRRGPCRGPRHGGTEHRDLRQLFLLPERTLQPLPRPPGDGVFPQRLLRPLRQCPVRSIPCPTMSASRRGGNRAPRMLRSLRNRTGGVAAGDFVVVIDRGPVGLFSALVAKAEGGTVMVCGTSRDRDRLGSPRSWGSRRPQSSTGSTPLNERAS